MIYFDSNYIVRCYLNEHGSEEVLKLAQEAEGCGSVATSKTECIAAFKRHFREGKINADGFQKVVSLFNRDEKDGVWTFFPVSKHLLQMTCTNLQTIAPDVFCRSGDAIHLTCAFEEGFQEIYSHDRHLLVSAPHFGLKGVDIIP